MSVVFPKAKRDGASDEDDLTVFPNENAGACLGSSVGLAAAPNMNVESFFSVLIVAAAVVVAVEGVDPNANVDPSFDGSVGLADVDPKANNDGIAEVAGAADSSFLAASPKAKLNLLPSFKSAPNVVVVAVNALPKVGSFGSSGFGKDVELVTGVPKAKREAGLSDEAVKVDVDGGAPKAKTAGLAGSVVLGVVFEEVMASDFLSKVLAPKANMAGRGAVVEAVVVVVAEAAVD